MMNPTRSIPTWLIGLIFAVAAFFITFPLFHNDVLQSQAQDLANHVRHIHEYKLALLEGQIPPLVAPDVNGGIRVPLFQYYTGTAYTVPGLISAAGINPYAALKLTLFILSLLSTLALFKSLKMIFKSNDNQAAFIGALTFQLFTFALVDLYDRGGYVEWISLEYAAFAFYGLINLAHSFLSSEIRFPPFSKFLIASISLLFFIASHPTQTVYFGLIIAILLLTYVMTQNIELRKKMNILCWISLAFLSSVLLTSWFWFPILQSFEFLKITKHAAFYSAQTNLSTLLWPWFHPIIKISGNWAPQIGIHITMATLLLFFFWKKIDLFSKVTLLLLSFLFLAVISPDYINDRFLLPLFAPMQWSYRLLIPLALVASITVGLAYNLLKQLTFEKISNPVLLYSCSFLIILNAIPYLYSIERVYHRGINIPLAQILSPSFSPPNTVGSYTLAGTHYAELGWIKDKQLILDTDISLPKEGVPFEAELTLAGKPNITVLINNQPIKTVFRTTNHQSYLRFTLYPPRGITPSQQIKFQSAAKKSIQVIESKFRPIKDKEWVKLPVSYTLSKGNKAYSATVAVKSSGLYQLPISYYPGLMIYINNTLIHQESNDKFLIITQLNEGENTIYIKKATPSFMNSLMGGAVIAFIMTLWAYQRRYIQQ